MELEGFIGEGNGVREEAKLGVTVNQNEGCMKKNT